MGCIAISKEWMNGLDSSHFLACISDRALEKSLEVSGGGKIDAWSKGSYL